MKQSTKRHKIVKFAATDEGKRLNQNDIARLFCTTRHYVSNVLKAAGMQRDNSQTVRKKKSDEFRIGLTRDDRKLALLKEPFSETAQTIKERPTIRKPKDDQVGKIVSDKTLSVDQQREELSWLAQNATRDEAKVAAHRALQQLDQSLGVQTKLGPGEPMSREAKVFRLSLMMQAVGEKVAREALKEAFGREEDEDFISSRASYRGGGGVPSHASSQGERLPTEGNRDTHPGGGAQGDINGAQDDGGTPAGSPESPGSGVEELDHAVEDDRVLEPTEGGAQTPDGGVVHKLRPVVPPTDGGVADPVRVAEDVALIPGRSE